MIYSVAVQIAVGAYLLGLTIGLFGALGKLHGSRITRWLLEFYTTLIRAVPELVLILLLYYAGTGAINSILDAWGYDPIDISGLVAGIVHAIPGMANLWLIVAKDTALLAVVGFTELALVTRQAAGMTRAYWVFFLAAGALYLLLTLFSNVLFRRLENYTRRGQPELS